jgi:leucine dehydrogenase
MLGEHLHMIDDPARGASGVIAVHSTALGPAAGGCRLWHYDTHEAMVTDAIRLARGMSYKNALAGLPLGGGKAVLRRPAGPFDRRALFEAFGDAVAALAGRYVTAEDVGTGVADMAVVASRTRHVAGLAPRPGRAGGDPSPFTALGVFRSMQVAARHVFGSDVRGLSVAVQGVGNVGERLCALLAQAGARLAVADNDAERAATVARRYGATLLSPDAILAAEADVLAPCALGAVLNARSIPRLKVALVCGGANNQLENDADGEALAERGIAYAPDYAVNAGGIINVAAEYLGDTVSAVEGRIETIATRIGLILERARAECRPSNAIADEMARALIADAQRAAA